MIKWYKCPRCIRYTTTIKEEKYICEECGKEFPKNEFKKQSIKEFGEIQYESD